MTGFQNRTSEIMARHNEVETGIPCMVYQCISKNARRIDEKNDFCPYDELWWLTRH